MCVFDIVLNHLVVYHNFPLPIWAGLHIQVNITTLTFQTGSAREEREDSEEAVAQS